MEKELYLIGNFKMNLTKSDIIPYLKKIKKLAKKHKQSCGNLCALSLFVLCKKIFKS